MPELITYFSNLGAPELIGVIGFVAYILAFGSVQFGLMNGNGITYSLANILAASLVGISLIAEFNLASALIQGSWILVGMIGLMKRIPKRAPVSVPCIKNKQEIGQLS